MPRARDRYRDSGQVFVNELGDPVYPDYLADRWKAAGARAGVPVINSKDERRTCATLIILNGVPIQTASALLGHATAACSMVRYVHHQPNALIAAATNFRPNVMKTLHPLVRSGSISGNGGGRRGVRTPDRWCVKPELYR